jgi:hypothetical protein
VDLSFLLFLAILASWRLALVFMMLLPIHGSVAKKHVPARNIASL